MKRTFAAYSNDNSLREHSSSGAIFSELAQEVLRKGGVVYGVALSSDCRSAEFIRVNDIGALDKLRGVKYLQAKVGSTFEKVKNDLENGITVLFVGTPCQANGLKCYLRRDYDNLYCVDMVCHGVPSQELWKKYIESIERKYKCAVKNVNFRSKEQGWGDYGVCRNGSTKSIFSLKTSDPYLQMFIWNYSLRPSCYSCEAKKNPLSDITMGDFWGIEKIDPDINDGKGISMVIARTDKGLALFDGIQSVHKKEVEYDEAIKENWVEHKSVERPAQRDTFYADMNSMGFKPLGQKYIPKSIKKRIKLWLLETPFGKFFRNREFGYTYYDYYLKIDLDCVKKHG